MITGFSTCFVLGKPSFFVGNPLQLIVFKLPTQITLSVSASHLRINLPFCSTLLFVIFLICGHDIWKCFRLRSSTVNHRKNWNRLAISLAKCKSCAKDFLSSTARFVGSAPVILYRTRHINKYVIPIDGGFVDHFHSFSHTQHTSDAGGESNTSWPAVPPHHTPPQPFQRR